MIEDLQDEIPKEAPKPKKSQPHRTASIRILAIFVWILYAGIIIIVSLPKMIVSVQESGIREIIASIPQLRESVATREAKLCFVIPSSTGKNTYVLCPQNVRRTGSSMYHDAIEGLLDGPGNRALSYGALSFIDSNTSLLGLTVSGTTAFVNLSSEFTKSGSSWGPEGLETACKQIERTMLSINNEIKEVVILIDGTELSR